MITHHKLKVQITLKKSQSQQITNNIGENTLAKMVNVH